MTGKRPEPLSDFTHLTVALSENLAEAAFHVLSRKQAYLVSQLYARLRVRKGHAKAVGAVARQKMEIPF